MAQREPQSSNEELGAAAERKATKWKPVALLLFAVVAIFASIPIRHAISYRGAVSMMEQGNYQEAIARLEALRNYKDSRSLAEEAKIAVRYSDAISLMQSGNFDEAIMTFDDLGDYKDSRDWAE